MPMINIKYLLVASVLDQLQGLNEGDHVELVARPETDRSVTGSDGSFFKLTHSNHQLLLVSSARVTQARVTTP